MTARWKQAAGIGGIVVVVVVLVFAGALTWYTREINRDYKELKVSEDVLIAAHGGPLAFTPPAGRLPEAGRVAAFAAVRQATAEWRQQLTTQVTAYAARGEEGGGPLATLRGFGAANDLARSFAAFWRVRNEALLEWEMGVGEYMWLYGLVYHGWLGHDPEAGRFAAASVPLAHPAPGATAWRRVHREGLTEAVVAVLTPFEQRLTEQWSAPVNPVELIFAAEDWSNDTVDE